MIKDAVISECLNYRYSLSRRWSDEQDNSIVFCMLNPSTADASIDDPTIKRCIGFGRIWGFSEIYVVNLYAFRTSKPKELWKSNDPVGLENDKFLKELAGKYKNIVCAWGGNAKNDRAIEVANILKESGANLWSFGVTQKGHPKHPLYIPEIQKLESWSAELLV